MKRARFDPPISEADISVRTIEKTELDLFSKPLEQDAILNAKDYRYGPDYAIIDGGPIEFSPVTGGEFFTDLANTYLMVKLKVTKANGTSLGKLDEEKVVPVADLLDALFNRVELYLNYTLVGSEIGNHHQLAYFRNLLNYGSDFKEALKSTIGYGEETKDGKKMMFPAWRYKLIENSKELTLCGRLQNGFFNCSKLLVPNVPIRIRLDRNNSQYCLLTADNVKENYKLNILSCNLFMRKVAVAPKILSAITHKLTMEPAIYPYMRTDLKHFLIPSGTQSIKQNNVLTGKKPCRLLFAVCPTASLSGGGYKNNPIVFSGSKYNISYVNFYVNDESVLPMPYQPDFKNKNYVMSYVGLLRAMRLLNSEKPISPMDYDAFGNAVTIFGVDLSADASNLAPLGFGNVSVEVHFKNNLTESVNGVLVAEYRSCVYVDQYKAITQTDL